MKYRKKPVVIEAMRWLPSMSDSYVQSIFDWMKQHGCLYEPTDGGGLLIKTLEGNMRADDGDYIIRGVQGEFYPCKPDIFRATYELLEVGDKS